MPFLPKSWRQRRWRRTRDASSQRKTKKAARAEARKYLTGEKVRRWESPKMIAQHGRAPWPPKKAAADSYATSMRWARVGDKYASGHRMLAWWQKGAWSLERANVSRSKKTGRFIKRRSS